MPVRCARRCFLAALALLALATAGCGAEKPAGEEPGAAMPTILVTGFGPFLDVKENPSWEAIRDLDGAVIGGRRIAVAQLEVTYTSAAEQLQAAIDRTRPERVLSLGVAPGSTLRLESTARNRDTAQAPDVKGEVRAGRTIREGGADTLPTRLPLAKIRAALTADGYEVSDSEDAGGYLCNHLFYELLTRRPTGIVGFVHVPALAPPWDRARLQRAIRRILEVLAAEPRG
jgi:pyroglutamyl-peptidase